MLLPLLEKALAARADLSQRLRDEKTDCYRLFHGVTEGAPGLTIDRYGSLVLIQTFREPLNPEDQTALQTALSESLSLPFEFAYNHRGKARGETFATWHVPSPEALEEKTCLEFGVKYLIRARHQGIDPWLFLDLRVGRRYIKDTVRSGSFLNLFAYTGSAGVVAAVAGATEICNVDFAASSLEVGDRNASLNAVDAGRIRSLQEDCLPVLRQLAGLPCGGRRNRTRDTVKLEPRQFDFVFLDPPTWSKGAFGAVDIENDYQTLFKPAVIIARPGGGRILATNHLASVDRDAWIESLKRCAAKAGRELKSVTPLEPESDFPSFDGKPPLKIVICEV